jgi:hypothetical protein
VCCMCPPARLPVPPSGYLAIYLSDLSVSIRFSIYLYLSVCPSICLSACMSVYLSIYISVCLSIYLSVYISIYMFLCLSIYIYHLSIYLSACLSICLYVCLSIYLSIYLSICLSVHLSIYLSITFVILFLRIAITYTCNWIPTFRRNRQTVSAFRVVCCEVQAAPHRAKCPQSGQFVPPPPSPKPFVVFPSHLVSSSASCATTRRASTRRDAPE